MTKGINHFLIVFDHATGRLEDLIEFGEDSDRAVAAYSDKERELEGRKLVEIVLIGSDSLDTVKLTHANYFDGAAAVSKYLAGISGPLTEVRRPTPASRPRSRVVTGRRASR
jgi:hypothetical protein